MQQCPIDKVVIFLIATPMRSNFADVLLDDIHGGLNAARATSYIIRMSDANEINDVWQFIQERSKGYDYVIGIDLNGNFNSPPMIEFERWRRFTILIDHPYCHAYKFAKYKPDLACSVIDRTHEHALKDVDINFTTKFLPHAGPPPEENVPPIPKRERDILFCGNVSNIILPGQLGEHIHRFPQPIQHITLKAIEQVISGECDIHSALKLAISDVLSDTISAVPLKTLSVICKTIETYVAGRMRLELLIKLLAEKDLKIDVVGRLREPLEAHGIEIKENGAIRFHNHLPFNIVTDMMSASKIVLNSNFISQAGSHERIWHGIARGCAIITNESSYLRDEFGKGEGINFIPKKQELLGPLLHQKLADLSRLDEIATAAKGHYVSRHTWRHRAKDLLKLLKIKM